jgi:hypothetical protein
MRVFWVVEDRRFYKIECLRELGTLESKRLKVTALNLFNPTAPPLFEKSGFLYYDTVSEGKGQGMHAVKAG